MTGRTLFARSFAVLGIPTRRTDELELLDGISLDGEELARNLHELAVLNRLPGGAGASIGAIERLGAGRRALSVLDVGTGAGDLAVAFARRGRATSRRWSVTATDLRPEVLEIARRRVPPKADITLALADARALPYPDAAFDVVHSSLLLHHLDPAEARSALGEMARVARIGVVVNDLQRGALHYLVTSATVLALTRGEYTRHDGVVSARRAYTLDERRGLLAGAGLVPAWESLRLAPRVATAAVRAGESGG